MVEADFLSTDAGCRVTHQAGRCIAKVGRKKKSKLPRFPRIAQFTNCGGKNYKAWVSLAVNCGGNG